MYREKMNTSDQVCDGQSGRKTPNRLSGLARCDKVLAVVLTHQTFRAERHRGNGSTRTAGAWICLDDLAYRSRGEPQIGRGNHGLAKGLLPSCDQKNPDLATTTCMRPASQKPADLRCARTWLNRGHGPAP